MPYKIDVLKDSDIIEVTYSGDITLNERIAVVHVLCCEFNLFDRFKLLINSTRTEQKMSLVEQQIFGKFIATKEEFKGALVAVLQTPSMETLVDEAQKYGYQIKQFVDYDTALLWLNQ